MKDDKILDFNFLNRKKSSGNYLPEIIGITFFFSIPVFLFLSASASEDDYHLYLPYEFIDSLFSEIIYDDFEARYDVWKTGLILTFYFFFLSILNLSVWTKNNRRKLRIFHLLITIGIPLIIFFTMIEDEILHHVRISDPIGNKQFLWQVKIFYSLLFVWIIFQIVFIKAFFEELSDNNFQRAIIND